MNRTTRTLIVLAVAVGVATAATYAVFIALKNRPAREVEIAQAFQVVATHPLDVGVSVTATDIKLVPWPAANQLKNGFTAVDQAVGRGVTSLISENEPLTSNNVAEKGAGAGLSPIIPTGMRAISVRVNEVIGVAGYVVPGTRVDVMVILKEGNDSLARVVVNNVTVLTAGTRIDQEASKEGKFIQAPVVTLLASPADAERIALAANEGQIILTLRNPMDVDPAASQGMRMTNLRSGTAPGAAPPAAAPAAAPRRAAPRVEAPPPPPPPTAPKIYTIETIRAAKRTEETIK